MAPSRPSTRPSSTTQDKSFPSSVRITIHELTYIFIVYNSIVDVLHHTNIDDGVRLFFKAIPHDQEFIPFLVREQWVRNAGPAISCSWNTGELADLAANERLDNVYE